MRRAIIAGGAKAASRTQLATAPRRATRMGTWTQGTDDASDARCNNRFPGHRLRAGVRAGGATSWTASEAVASTRIGGALPAAQTRAGRRGLP
jgi:hypothetical protein